MPSAVSWKAGSTPSPSSNGTPAAPVAGGLTSALFIFGTLVPYLGLLRIPATDKPAAQYTEAVESGDFGSRTSDDTLLEVQIDDQGRMVDYSVLQGQMNSDV